MTTVISVQDREAAEFRAYDIGRVLESMVDNTTKFWNDRGYEPKTRTMISEEDVYHLGKSEEELDRSLGEQKMNANDVAQKIVAKAKLAYWGVPESSRNIYLSAVDGVIDGVLKSRNLNADSGRAAQYMGNKILVEMTSFITNYEKLYGSGEQGKVIA